MTLELLLAFILLSSSFFFLLSSFFFFFLLPFPGTFKLRFTSSSSNDGLNNMVEILSEVVETTASKAVAATAPSTPPTPSTPSHTEQTEQWLERDYLGPIESDKERFLSLAVPGMNCYKAQYLLGLVNFLECLSWYSESVSAISRRHPGLDHDTIACVRFALAPPYFQDK